MLIFLSKGICIIQGCKAVAKQHFCAISWLPGAIFFLVFPAWYVKLYRDADLHRSQEWSCEFEKSLKSDLSLMILIPGCYIYQVAPNSN